MKQSSGDTRREGETSCLSVSLSPRSAQVHRGTVAISQAKMKQAIAAPSVVAGLVPAIHVGRHAGSDVDARVKPGHDGGKRRAKRLRPVVMDPGPRAQLRD